MPFLAGYIKLPPMIAMDALSRRCQRLERFGFDRIGLLKAFSQTHRSRFFGNSCHWNVDVWFLDDESATGLPWLRTWPKLMPCFAYPAKLLIHSVTLSRNVTVYQ